MPSDVSHYALLAFSSLFSVINPISAAPVFVSLTDGFTGGMRRRAALRACVAATITLAVFAVAGGAIFQFFGITVPAFQIVGGLLFTTMGLRTLEKGKEDVPEEDRVRADPSIVPLGIPLISGPGAISTVMVLVGGAGDGIHRMALAAAIGINILLTLGTLFAAPTIVAAIGETGQRITAKIMGLITAVIGVQFAINGITTVTLEILKTSRG